MSTPKWDLSFFGEVARERIVEFKALPKTLIADPPAEFMPPAYHSPEVVDWPPQVINEDSLVVTTSGGGANEDNEVMQIDNLAGVLSSEGHPPSC